MVTLPVVNVVSAELTRSGPAEGRDIGTASLVPFTSAIMPPLSAEAAAPVWIAVSSAISWAVAPVPVMFEDLPQPASARSEAARHAVSARSLRCHFMGGSSLIMRGAPCLDSRLILPGPGDRGRRLPAGVAARGMPLRAGSANHAC